MAVDGHRVRRVIRFSGRVGAGWKDDRAGGLAAEMAFFALLSVFPGLLAVVAAVGWLDGLFGADLLRSVERELLGVLETFLSDNAEGTVSAVEALFRKGSGGVFTVGMVTALWSASRGMAAALRAIAAINDAADERSAVRRRLLALGLAVGSMLVISLMLAMLVLGPLLGAGRAAAAAVGVDEVYGTVWELLGLPVAFVVLVAWATAILHAAPHLHRGWRSHLAAGALIGVGWLFGSLGLRLYLAVLGGNPVFGILGGALVVIVWLYLLSLALMLGAEVNAVLDAPPKAPFVAETRHWDGHRAGYGGNERPGTGPEVERVENVVVLKLADLDRAREAMRELQGLQHQGAFRLEAVAVVKGRGHGRVAIVEDHGAGSSGGVAGATLGAVLGAVTAPAEARGGGAGSAIVRSVAEVADVEASEAASADISGSAPPRGTAVVAVVSEPNSTELDRVAVRCGGELVRRPRRDVDRELATLGAALLASRAEIRPDRPLGQRVRDLKGVVKEALGRTP